ncbi:MAG: Txe/YoeB family addiction module toxin [Oscillospiraceae bacterium]|nr:Txe/YoeB family addiction module toxin [Oscillospiraceae bacterium]
MIKSWYETAWDDFIYWEAHDKQIYKRIIMLIKDIDRNGYTGIGKPEPLKGDLSGLWSRRIDDKNRLVYKIENEVIYIAQCGSHYRQK